MSYDGITAKLTLSEVTGSGASTACRVASYSCEPDFHCTLNDVMYEPKSAAGTLISIKSKFA